MDSHTRVIQRDGRTAAIEFVRCVLRVVSGPDKGKEAPFEVGEARIGSSPACAMVLTDSAVSRVHCQIEVGPRGFLLRDLGSTNGVFVHGMQVFEAILEPGVRFTVGGTTLELAADDDSDRVEIRLSSADRFGRVLGRSARMREIFFLLEKMASKDVTILLTGETGTGKEVFARSIHEASARKDAPFLTLDCGALPANLVEAELFGHAKGAFTGATAERAGLFEDAHGGTVFLDEIGELPLEQQAKLLRVLESREVKRVGENHARTVDVRIIAATNRLLAEEVEAGTFRRDLYFRLSVAEIHIPALRERREDIPMLAEEFLSRMRRPDRSVPKLSPGAMAALQEHPWPGNVRELRNVLEKAVALADGDSLETTSIAIGSVSNQLPTAGGPFVDPALPYETAHERFEREYLMAVLKANDMNVSAAARAAGIHRQTIHRLLRKHGIRLAELRER